MWDCEFTLHKLIKEREDLFEEKEALWNDVYKPKDAEWSEEADDNYEADPRVIEIEKESSEKRERILDIIEKHHKSLPFETVFEALTSTGDAPSLLYDDNGNFAVEGDGIQGIAEGKFESFEGVWFTTKDSWKSTVREALTYYIEKRYNDRRED